METQDKALRRISELREQCSLEQQAKAHLESALRLEMDELQCVVKTLKSKLELLGENPDIDLNGSTVSSEAYKEFIDLQAADNHSKDLIDITNDGQEDYRVLADKYKAEIQQLTTKLEESQKRIKELQVREEENTICIAENKMMIHSELENKEIEMKKLKERINAFEKDIKKANQEKVDFQEKAKELKSQINEFQVRVTIYFHFEIKFNNFVIGKRHKL